MKKPFFFLALFFLVFCVAFFVKAQYSQNNSSVMMQMQQQINYLQQQVNSWLKYPTTPTTPTAPALCCDGSIPWINSVDRVCQSCPVKCGPGIGMYPNSGTPCINYMTKKAGWCGAGSCSSTPPTPKKTTNCCMCAYQDFPECNINLNSELGKKNCPTYKDKTTCESDPKLSCSWHPTLGCIFNLGSGCDRIGNKDEGIFCQLDFEKQDKCISRFKNDCWYNNWSAKSCSNFQIVGAKELPALDEIKSFLDKNKCDTFMYYMHGHGDKSECYKLNNTVKACIECDSINDCKNIGIVSNACSQFQNSSSVSMLAEIIQKKLCALKSSTTVTITANQAVSCEFDKTPKTIKINCKNITTSFFKCSDLPKFCYQDNESITCSNYDKSGVYIGNSEYLCCKDNNLFGVFSRWTLPMIGSDGKKQCPSNTVKTPVSVNKEQLLASILDSISNVISQLAEKLGVKLKK
jgi:hypothetical protein